MLAAAVSGFVSVIPRRRPSVRSPLTYAHFAERYGWLPSKVDALPAGMVDRILAVEDLTPYDLTKPARMLVPFVPMSPRRRAILTGWIGPRGSAIRAAYHRRRR